MYPYVYKQGCHATGLIIPGSMLITVALILTHVRMYSYSLVSTAVVISRVRILCCCWLVLHVLVLRTRQQCGML